MKIPIHLLVDIIKQLKKGLLAIFFCVIILAISNSTHAQVYYLLNSGTGNTTNAANTLRKIDYNGSNETIVTSAIPNPGLVEVDAPNNRIFAYNAFLNNRVINVINMTTGATINTIDLPSGVQTSGPSVASIKYDAINNWVYYVTNVGNGSTSPLNAIYRSKPDGTQNTTLASQFALHPQWLALDIPNNRVFIYDGIFSNRRILTFDLSTNTVTGSAAVSNIATAIAYDAETDYIYYTTSDNDAANATVNDALRKTRPGGAGGELVVKSSLIKSPQYLALDAGNNRAFIYEGYVGPSFTIRLDDTGIYAVDLTTGATTRVLDHSTLQNTPSYYRVYGLYTPSKPVVVTSAATNVSAATATIGGDITRSDATVTERGVIYSLSNTTPTIGASAVTKTISGTGSGVFSANISGLNGNTTYYARAYATSAAGTAYGPVTTFTTIKFSQTITFASTASATYGDADFSTATASSSLPVSYSSSNTAVATIVNGKIHAVAVGTTTITAAQSGDNSYNAATSVAQTLTIAPKPITVTANAQTKVYGNTEPALTYTTTGVVGNDAFTGTLSREAGTTVGTYAINQGSLSYGNNYTITFVTANLTITKRPLHIYPIAQTKVYGNEEPPSYPYQFLNGTSVAPNEGMTGTFTRESGEAVGTYALSIGAKHPVSLNTGADMSSNYDITFTPNNLTITKRSITFSAFNGTKVYGEPDPEIGYIIINGNLLFSDVPSGSFARTAGEDVGNYSITQGTFSFGNNYESTFVNAGNFAITPAALTVAANAGQSKQYGDADPVFTYSVTSGKLKPGDALTGSLSRVTGGNPGTYAITQGTLFGSNYNLTFNSADFTVNKRQLDVAISSVTKVYGDADPSIKSIPFTYINGTSPAGNETAVLNLARPAEAIFTGTYQWIDQGTRMVNATTNEDVTASYNINFTTNNLTITKRPLHISPVAATKTYGNDDPGYPYRFLDGTSNVSSEGMTGTFGREAGDAVGIYALNLGTKRPIDLKTGADRSSNYDITFTPNNLTITKRPITFTAANATKTYGTADPVLGYTITSGNLVFSDSPSGSFARETGENVGSYGITPGTLSFGNNYNATFVNSGSFIITPAAITVTANAVSKTYGDADPEFTYTSAPLATGDSFTGSLIRATGETVGSYAIGQGTLVLNNNYALNFTGADLTINKRTVNITAEAQNKTYGDSDPEFSYNATGIVNGDTFTGTLNRQSGEAAGTYTLTQGTLSINSNYTTVFNSANLTINKAILTYVANPASKYFSAMNPAFTGSVTGFLNGETIANATTGTLGFQSGADASSPVGSYDITGSGLSAANYNFVQAPANASAFSVVYDTDATLSNLSVAEGNLNQPFSPNQIGYFINVANNVTSANITGTLNSPFASLAINGTPTVSGNAKNVPLAAGTNVIYLDITAQDGSTKQYQLNVYRALSANNNLSSISFSNVSFTPVFNANTLTYNATVGNEITSTDVYGIPVDSTATIIVNGVPVSSNQPGKVNLNVGENLIYIQSKAQNGDDKYYVVNVTRKESPDATLTSIGNSTLTLNKPFTANMYNYYATVGSGIENTTFLPVSTDRFAAITVNGQPVNIYAGNFVSLAYGNNLVNISVTSQDGSSTLNYIVNVIRQRSNDANLVNLTIPDGGLINEVFDPAVYNYTANVSDSTYTGLLLKINRSNITSFVKVNNQPVADPEHYIMPLHGGLNNFKIEVTSQDTSTTKTYNLSVTRAGQAPPAQSAEASLASLTVIGGTSFSRNFNFSYQELETVTAANSVTSISFFINRSHTGATVKVNGAAVADPENAGPYNLAVGDNVINISVTAEDGVATKNYEVHINRLPFVDVSLASLKVNKGSLTPAFAPGITTYNVTTASSDSIITITPVANNLTTTVVIGTDTISASKPSSVQELFGPGQTRNITIRVTAADGITNRTYRLRVTRALPSATATLANVTLSSGTLSPVFNAETLTYSANVANTITKISVKPILTDGNASIHVRVNGGAYVPTANNALSAQLKLNLGINKIDVLVTAEDNSTTQTYTLNVKRLYSITDATLAELSLSDTTISPVFVSTITSYKAYVGNFTTSATVKAAPTNPDAKVTINGIVTDAVSNTVTIPLSIGTNYATVVVKSANGAATKTYEVKISRAPGTGSGNADVVFSLRNKPKLLELPTGPAKVNYMASIDPSATFITVTPTSKDANASVEIEGVVTPSGTASAPITLTGDTTIINILSTAQNGVTKTYSIAVVKSGSNNADVTLALSGNSTLVKGGTSTATQVNLTTSVPVTATSLTLTATSVDVNAKVKIQGVLTPRGQAITIPLTGETTMINVVSTAQDGVTTRTYSIAVSKKGSNNAGLAFTLSGNPKLITTTNGPAKVNYITSVDQLIPLTVTAKSEDGNAKVTIQGLITARNQPSAPIALTGDTTMIRIVCTAQDGITTSTYSVAVLKRGSNNADVSLALSGNPTLTKVGSSSDAQVNYTTTVGAATTSLTVTATAKDVNANVKIQGMLTPGGQASAPIALISDTTMITVVSTAQDGVTTRTYTIAVVKPAATLHTSDIANNSVSLKGVFDSTIPKEVSIYPNPFVDNVSIELKGYNATQAGVTVSSMQGKTLFNRTLQIIDNKVQLSLSDLSQGIYIINVTINGERKGYRIMKN